LLARSQRHAQAAPLQTDALEGSAKERFAKLEAQLRRKLARDLDTERASKDVEVQRRVYRTHQRCADADV
jgi:hypothetical protein